MLLQPEKLIEEVDTPRLREQLHQYILDGRNVRANPRQSAHTITMKDQNDSESQSQ